MANYPMGRPVPHLEMSASRQAVYFDKDPMVVCWADSGVPDDLSGCQWKAETDILLCKHHFREILGHDPT